MHFIIIYWYESFHKMIYQTLKIKNLKVIFSLIFFAIFPFLLNKHLNAFGTISPPKAEKDFLKNNLVIINSPSGQSTGSILGKFEKGGFSSKVNYVDHLKDLNQIRLNNNLNIFLVYFLFVIKILKKPIKFIKAI